GAQPADPRRRPVALQRLADQGVERLAVRHALRIPRVTGVGRPLRVAGDLGEARELRVVADRERHHAVGRGIGRVGNDAGVAVAETARVLAGDQVIRGDVDQHRDTRIVEAYLDVL